MTTPLQNVLTRMAAMFVDIDNEASALPRPIVGFSGPPTEAISDDMLPVMVPVVSTATNTEQTRGVIRTQRTITARMLLAPVQEGVDAAYLGSEKYAEAVPYLDYVYWYFCNHPRMSTSTLGDLAGVLDVRIASDTGIVARVAPGGAQYWSIDFSVAVLLNMQYCLTL